MNSSNFPEMTCIFLQGSWSWQILLVFKSFLPENTIEHICNLQAYEATAYLGREILLCTHLKAYLHAHPRDKEVTDLDISDMQGSSSLSWTCMCVR